jgi:hypothetical protein
MNWAKKNSGLTDTTVYSLAFSGSNIFAGTYSGVFLSTNSGTSWSLKKTGLTNTVVQSLTVNGFNIYAGTQGGVFLSTNNGTGWTAKNNNLTNTYVLSLGMTGTKIFAGTSGGIFLSTNNGINWTDVTNNLANTTVYAIAFSDTNIIVGTGGGVFLSTNQGINWTNTTNGLNNSWVWSLGVSGSDVFAGTVKAGVWTRPLSELGLPVELTSFSAYAKGDIISLYWETATEINNMGFNVERSANKSDWTKIAYVQGNQNSTTIRAYSYLDKSVSKSGKYYYRLKQIDNNGSYKYSNIIEVDFIAPSVFNLSQNFPNPYNPSTMIKYQIPKSAFVNLKVYDILGKEVATLVNEDKVVGSYEINFDASKLASGVYIYQLKANDFAASKKMILIK